LIASLPSCRLLGGEGTVNTKVFQLSIHSRFKKFNSIKAQAVNIFPFPHFHDNKELPIFFIHSRRFNSDQHQHRLCVVFCVALPCEEIKFALNCCINDEKWPKKKTLARGEWRG
jgi:hypothetical protein